MNLITQEVQTRAHAAVEEDRLQVLAKTSRRLENARLDPRPIDAAILDTTQAEERTRQERWRAQCDEADVEMQLGHLLAANDLIFRILAENPGHTAAQQMLSELQIRFHKALETSGAVLAEERYAMEGFYAYGQADYETAATAWGKALTLIQQSYTSSEAAQHLAALRFGPYQQVAQAHVDEDRRVAQTYQLFQQASEYYQRGRYSEALDTFRKVAVLNPEFPQLGENLARAEAAVEKERAQRLGEEKHQEVAHLIEQGMKALEQASYSEAERAFKRTLALDAANTQAQSYLTMVQAEIQRRHDPKAAQQHYEAGLIAYASGRLEEAIREWTIATRMNPYHEKATNALSKVQKELALNKELP